MIKRIFIDTNVMMDRLGERKPFYDSIAKIASLGEKGDIVMVVSPISYATVNYFLTKYEDSKTARQKLRKFKIISEFSSLDENTIVKGLNSSFKDFEDALQYFSASDSACDLILTRNGKDFKKSVLPVMTPDEFLKYWQTK
jgi:predicted nucleic acid-binding protein